jgi:uncharacterized membrane protein YfcA
MTSMLLFALGFIAGGYGTIAGVGGGFLVVPLLLLFYPEMAPREVTAVSLLMVFFNTASGSVAYARQARIDYRTGLLFALFTVPGAVGGAWLTKYISGGLFDLIFAGALLILAAFLFLQAATRRPHHVLRATATRRIVDARGYEYVYSYNQGLGLAISLVVGFVSSLLGIGGGIIHVPALTLLLGFPVHIATATSHLILSITALTASVTHLVWGDFAGVWGIAAALSIGGVLGAQLGAFLSARFRSRLIIRLLALALCIVAVRLLVQSL